MVFPSLNNILQRRYYIEIAKLTKKYGATLNCNVSSATVTYYKSIHPILLTVTCIVTRPISYPLNTTATISLTYVMQVLTNFPRYKRSQMCNATF